MHCLPAHRGEGSHRRRDGRAAFRRLRRGREPAARAKGHIDLVFRRARPVIERAGTTPKDAEKETPSRVVSFDTRNDRVLPFAVEAADMRGRLVRLGPAVDTILSHYDYPAPVARVLGEGVALAALLGSMLELQGRFQLQTRSDGAVDLLIVDYDTPGRLRGFLRYDLSRVDPASSTASLLGDGHMALTIERGEEGSRYQGVVKLDGEGLAHVARRRFPPVRANPIFHPAGRGGGGHPAGTQLARRRHRRAISAAQRRRRSQGRSKRRFRNLERRRGVGVDHRRSRTRGPQPFRRAAALSAVSRARRQSVPRARARRALPLLGGACGNRCAVFRASTGSTWSATTGASASPANFVELSAVSTRRSWIEGLAQGPQKLTGFCDQNLLQRLDFARFLILGRFRPSGKRASRARKAQRTDAIERLEPAFAG